MAKQALFGFDRLKFFPVTKNDTSGYKVDATGAFEVPNAQSMTKDVDSSENKIYADDGLYLNLKEWNGINSTITVAELSLELMEKLGFGEYDAASKTLKANPQGENKEFALTFRILRVDNTYRLFKIFSFTVNEIKESETSTKGSGGGINPYQIIGTFTGRKFDNRPFDVRDTEDSTDITAAIAWLNAIESAGTP